MRSMFTCFIAFVMILGGFGFLTMGADTYPVEPVTGGSQDETTPSDVSDVYFAQDGSRIEHTPSIVQVSNGSYFIAYESGDATWHFMINITWSPDGVNWAPSWIVISTGGSYGNRHPTLIQRQDGDLQVVYLTDRSGGFELYTSISSDGHSWTEYGPLGVQNPAVNPFIIQQEDGNYAMSYQVTGSFFNINDGAWFTTSTDGINWGSGVKVCSYSNNHRLPRLMKANGGDYMLTYQGDSTGGYEIWYKTSSDGNSWSSETRLTNTGNSHDSFPMELVNGTYMIFFCSSIGGGGYDLYRKWSPDMSTWSDDELIDVGNIRFDTEPHPCQLISNQTFLLSWGHESSGAVGAYEDVDVALVWIEDMTADVIPPAPPTDVRATLSGFNTTINWVLSADDATDVERYEVYRGATFDSNGLGYVFTGQMPAGSTHYVDPAVGDGDASDYFYYVRAVDAANNHANSTTQGGKSAASIDAGWNLVSTPLALQDTSLVTVLQTVTWDYVQYYDALDNADHWKSNCIHKPGSLNDLNVIDHTMAAWVSSSGTDIYVTAGQVTDASIPLYTGWNFVSYAYLTPHTVGWVKNDIGPNCDVIEGFDSLETYRIRALGDAETMSAGSGYWIHVTSDSAWNINNY